MSVIQIHHASCIDWLAEYNGPLFDACVTDPPYHLTSIVKRFGKGNAAPCKEGATGAYARASRGFMGKEWDGGDIAFRPETWALVMKVLKPGAHIVAFSGTRTYHRMACAIEDAGFEIRDQIGWLYGSGFPKSHNISKAIDKINGAEREIVGIKQRANKDFSENLYAKAESNKNNNKIFGYGVEEITAAATKEAQQWEGWGTALKPAWEPVVVARKPISEKSIASNVLKHGTGAINIDGCRVGEGTGQISVKSYPDMRGGNFNQGAEGYSERENVQRVSIDKGRWPANVIHDGSEEVVAAFPDTTALTRKKFQYF